MKFSSLLLFASALFIFACSVPEDKLWEKRVSDASKLTGDSTYLAAIDLDMRTITDSIGTDSLAHMAARDLEIYLFSITATAPLDTQKFLNDSVIPRIRMALIQQSLLTRFSGQPFDTKITQWSTKNWHQDQNQLLEALLRKTRATFENPALIDSLIHVALNASDTSIAKIPVAAVLLRDRGDYVWAVISKWGEKTDSISDSALHRYEHIEGVLFNATTGAEFGRFFCE
jgi:hypothetical protein